MTWGGGTKGESTVCVAAAAPVTAVVLWTIAVEAMSSTTPSTAVTVVITCAGAVTVKTGWTIAGVVTMDLTTGWSAHTPAAAERRNDTVATFIFLVDVN